MQYGPQQPYQPRPQYAPSRFGLLAVLMAAPIVIGLLASGALLPDSPPSSASSGPPAASARRPRLLTPGPEPAAPGSALPGRTPARSIPRAATPPAGHNKIIPQRRSRLAQLEPTTGASAQHRVRRIPAVITLDDIRRFVTAFPEVGGVHALPAAELQRQEQALRRGGKG